MSGNWCYRCDMRPTGEWAWCKTAGPACGGIHLAPVVQRPVTTVMPPRSTDDEASALLDELSKLQHLMVMQMRRGPEWIAAADLVQRTRVLIIERCKKPSNFDVRFDREPDALAFAAGDR